MRAVWVASASGFTATSALTRLRDAGGLGLGLAASSWPPSSYSTLTGAARAPRMTCRDCKGRPSAQRTGKGPRA